MVMSVFIQDGQWLPLGLSRFRFSCAFFQLFSPPPPPPLARLQASFILRKFSVIHENRPLLPDYFIIFSPLALPPCPRIFRGVLEILRFLLSWHLKHGLHNIAGIQNA